MHNPSVSELYEYALQPEHRKSPGDPSVSNTTITSTGALSVSSGQKTGRVPKTKRIVYDSVTRDEIWWGDVNIPLDPKGYVRNRTRTIDFLNMVPRVFVIDGYAGSDEDYRI